MQRLRGSDSLCANVGCARPVPSAFERHRLIGECHDTRHVHRRHGTRAEQPASDERGPSERESEEGKKMTRAAARLRRPVPSRSSHALRAVYPVCCRTARHLVHPMHAFAQSASSSVEPPPPPPARRTAARAGATGLRACAGRVRAQTLVSSDEAQRAQLCSSKPLSCVTFVSRSRHAVFLLARCSAHALRGVHAAARPAPSARRAACHACTTRSDCIACLQQVL
jgi:hypothetical protein